MGKSDTIVFEEYASILKDVNHVESTAFLGFSKENEFTLSIKSKTKDFYDLDLKNWNINEDWSLNKKYDLIVNTRSAFFSKRPDIFIKKCQDHLNHDGLALVDWGLGDHWRFKNYKVGWVRNNEHEWAYKEGNFLYSCFWNDLLLEDREVKNFWNAVKQRSFGYHEQDDLKNVVSQEVPCLVDYNVKDIKTKFLWPESPQLYIITLISK
jgi:hypothetical protein